VSNTVNHGNKEDRISDKTAVKHCYSAPRSKEHLPLKQFPRLISSTSQHNIGAILKLHYSNHYK